MSASERCNLPDTIIGLGFAGKQVVYHYLRTNWILTEGLESRDDIANPDFNAFVIDTATGERAEDRATVDRINERIETICRDEFGRGPENINTQLRYINPLDGTNDQYLTEVGLTSETTVREVARSSSLRAWWLEEDEAMLTGGDYEEGVVRRRGLSKALYHISQTGADPLGDLLARADGSVAMVVGLGGGTGSGIFLDIAKQLRSTEGHADAVNLFAIVPGTGEHRRKKANAHAALSEIEYLSLQDRNPFKNVVLVPYGPARSIDNDEFYDSVVQTIVARENTEPNLASFLDESSSDGPPVYAPFTVAFPQVHRYAVEDKKSAKEEVADFCETKLGALDRELTLYDRLESFLTSEFENHPAGEALADAMEGERVPNDEFSLTEEELHDLKERYDGLVRFVNIDHFSFLDYEAPERWQTLLADFESQYRAAHGDYSDGEITERLITDIPVQVEKQVEDPEELYPAEKDQTDRQLETVIRKELDAIKRRGDIQRALHLVDVDTIENGVRAALDPEIGSIAASSDISERKNALHQTLASKEHNADLLGEFLGDEGIESRLDESRQDWRRDVEPHLRTLISIDSNRARIEELLNRLDAEVTSTMRAIQNASHPDDIPRDPLDFDSFDELNALLSESGVEEIDEVRLTDTLTSLANAHREKLKAQNLSLIARFFTSSTEEHRRRYGQFLDDVDRDLVSVTPTRSDFEQPFRCSFDRQDGYSARLEVIDRNRGEIPEEICEIFRTHLSHPAVDEATINAFVADDWEGEPPELEWPGGDIDAFLEELRSELAKDLSDTTVTTLLNEFSRPGDERTAAGIAYRGIEATSLQPVENLLDDLREEIGELRQERDRYEWLQDIIETYGGRQDLVLVDRESLSEFDIATDREYTYVRQVGSEQALLQYDDIVAAGLWDPDSSERETLEYGLEQFAKNAASLDRRFSIKHGTLEVPSATSAAGETMYQGHFVLPMFMSRCFRTEENPSGEIFEAIEDEFRNRIHIPPGDDGYAAKATGYGGEWDVSLTTFIGGVFLDNFQPLIQAENGYKAAYESERENLIESIRIRHAHGVDGRDETIADPGYGGFVFRENVFNLDDTREDGDLATFIELDTESLVDHLFDESFVETEQFESTVDLDDL